jgi:signal peptidase I
MDMPPPSDEGREPETYHRGRGWVTPALSGAAVASAIAWTVLRRRPFRVEIEGASMVPTLLPGDWALAAPGGRMKREDIVVVEHPGRPGYEMVKRLVALPGDTVQKDRVLGPGEFWVEGDHASSYSDSREFGPVSIDAIKARVLLVYWPLERRRLL